MKHPIDPTKIDCVFKALLGAEANRRLLIHFLNAVLGAALPAPIRQVGKGRGQGQILRTVGRPLIVP